MKTSIPIIALFLSTALALPAPEQNVVLDDAAQRNLKKWLYDVKEFVGQDRMLYEPVSHSSFEQHRLRITQPNLCDPEVKQYSGYLDISQTKHLFFWFFESRNDPKNAPIILWLNGGPGCSSSMGLFVELGPCKVAEHGNSTVYNPYSWTTHANIIFLDQPVQVGFSYDEEGLTVDTSSAGAKDVYAFLQLFFHRFTEYASLPFHIAAQSYGGVYAPNIANLVYQQNKELERSSIPPASTNLKHVNLASVILANAESDPKTQQGSVAEYVCEGPYAIYDDPQGPECTDLRIKVKECQRLIDGCYTFPKSKHACIQASLYCMSQITEPLFSETGYNPYDVRKPCDPSKGGMCYEEMEWVTSWMNVPEHQAALGVNRTFQSCNMEVNKAFFAQGDDMHNSALLLEELVDDGVRLLVYAGDTDLVCNFIGNERWVEHLDTRFREEFVNATLRPWNDRSTGRQAGLVRSAGQGAGNVTFVRVYEAGHLTPYDQPSAALDLISRWIGNVPLGT